MKKITIDMNPIVAMTAMSEGNPGALDACLELMKVSPKVDPEGFLGGFGKILMLDTLKIYGERIYMLHNDVCGRDTSKMVALLRAWQLGGLAGVTEDALNHAIDNYGLGIDVDAAVASVKERLPEFGEVSER